MKTDRWISTGLFLILVGLCTWFAFHDAKARLGYAVLKDNNQKVNALLDAHDVAYYEFEGTHWIIARREGETASAFRERCTSMVFLGVDESAFCWESDCTRLVPPFGVYHVKLCSSTQEGLDKLVEDYCSDPSHSCAECP